MPQSAPIWIAVPTFRRPAQLRHLLETLEREVQRDDVLLLVADNDGVRREGAAVAADLVLRGYALPLRAAVVERPGLCAVRNAIAETALADPAMRQLAMIDDDEWPQPGWLDALIACQAETGADAVGGPVEPHFVGDRPRWTSQTLVFRPEERRAGPTPMLWASNNLLLTRGALERVPAPRFDPRFDRSGGEDLDFLSRLRDAGGRFGWAPDARVSEWVTPDRARIGWVFARMWRIGFTETVSRRKRAKGPGATLMLCARSAAILVLRTAGLAGLLWPGARRVDIAGQWIKSWGRLYALAGGAPVRPYGAE